MHKMSDEDTIAAISTAISESGIGIVRISGPDAIKIADKVYRSPGGKKHLKDVPTHTIHYGYVADLVSSSLVQSSSSSQDSSIGEKVHSSEGVIDEVLVSVMRAPKTYTAEDVVEINCHGGVLVVTKVLDAVIRAGARPAEPGEFTKRAFLNGRIDLTEAEAVMDVIESKNQFALQNSVSQVRGSLYRTISGMRSQMIYQSAHIEACLDDPEALSFDEYVPELSEYTDKWISEVSHLLETADSGRLMQEGIRTVIVGKPNAGKSSLLNLLLGEERAIVTPIAGTTRDVLTETVTIGGMTLMITDTAGIRDTEDIVEKIGVQRARDAVEKADLVLYLIDSSTSIDIEDREIFNLIREKNVIILQNKTDLNTVTDIESIRRELGKLFIKYKCADERQNTGDNEQSADQESLETDVSSKIPVIPFSAKERTGLDDLIAALKKMFFSGQIAYNDEVIITNARHKALLQRTLESLRQLKRSIDDHMPEDFYTIDLMSAYESMGEITGEEIGDDLADEIFSRFCMGK